MRVLWELQEGLKISAEAIRVNLLRSILTTIGIVIGIVTVCLMATALAELDRSFSEAISFIGTDVLYVDRRAWFINSEQDWTAMSKRRKISPAQARQLVRRLGEVQGAAPTATTQISTIQYGRRTATAVTLIGTSEQYLVTGGTTLASGRFLTAAEAEGGRGVCVIGADIADNLFAPETPLGRRLRVGQQSLMVVGVLEKRGSAFGRMSLDNQIILPLNKLVRSYRPDPSCTIQVKVGDPARVETVREEVRGLMRAIRRVRPSAADDFTVNQQEQLRAQFDKASGVIAMAGFFITGLSLGVGGIGIMNIMFVSVAERTREIGLRKALGARRRTILLQFLLEAASICLLGGVLALLLTAIAVAVARHWMPGVVLPLQVVALALSVALGTGVISGFLPAYRASRLSPVKALSSE